MSITWRDIVLNLNRISRRLDTGTGLVEQVAHSMTHFEEMIRTAPDLVDEWFLPPLVERLHAAGKKPKVRGCYGFTILPVFAEGKFDVENMFVAPVSEQFHRHG